MTAIQQIDGLLNFFYDKRLDERPPFLEEIRKDEKLIELAGTKDELERMIGKLLSDKYTHIYMYIEREKEVGSITYPSVPPSVCNITFAGRLFKENDGYGGELTRHQNLEAIRKSQALLAHRSYWVNFLVGVGTIGLLLFEILKAAYHIYPCIHNFFS